MLCAWQHNVQEDHFQAIAMLAIIIQLFLLEQWRRLSTAVKLCPSDHQQLASADQFVAHRALNENLVSGLHAWTFLWCAMKAYENEPSHNCWTLATHSKCGMLCQRDQQHHAQPFNKQNDNIAFILSKKLCPLCFFADVHGEATMWQKTACSIWDFRSMKRGDKGAISTMIQSKKPSRGPSSRSGTAVHPKEQDARSKIQNGTFNGNEEMSCHDIFHHDVAHSCGLAVTDRTSQWQNMRTICDQSCQWDVNLVELDRQMWSRINCMSFLFVQNHICFVSEMSEQETLFSGVVFAVFQPLFAVN